MCARLYAKLLEELGVLPEGSCFVETSGAQLVSGGMPALRSALATTAAGGVLFVDEAYQLIPTSWRSSDTGDQVLDLLLTEMEDRRGSLVVVFAGYKARMERLLEHNEGLISRFRQAWDFPDFSEEELVDIATKQLASLVPPFTVGDKYTRIMARRLGRQRGVLGFGNARAVRNSLEDARDRQAKRILAEREARGAPDVYMLSRDDLLGPRSLDTPCSEPLRDLHALRGLTQVKESVEQLLRMVETNVEREELDLPAKDVCLKRLFLGGPGTGKTTVASIYGRILAELGLLTKGDVLVKKPADFIDLYIGGSEANTKRIFASAAGCVVVIDEAYGLHSGSGSGSSGNVDSFRTAVVDTLVAEAHGTSGSDICVLLLGYDKPMRTFMRDRNPGLQRRFQVDNPFVFEDFSDEVLSQVLQDKAARQALDVPFESARAAVQVLARQRIMPNFGTCPVRSSFRSFFASLDPGCAPCLLRAGPPLLDQIYWLCYLVALLVRSRDPY